MAISPVDKRGIKLGTLLTEIGLVSEVAGQARASGGDWGKTLLNVGDAILHPAEHRSTALMWTGVALCVLGKFVPQVKYIGPVGLR